MVVDYRMMPYLEDADHLVTLQQLVNTPEITMRRLSLGKLNQAQWDLLQHWRSLHPTSLLEQIGITAQ
jgi:hypothetical protein